MTQIYPIVASNGFSSTHNNDESNDSYPAQNWMHSGIGAFPAVNVTPNQVTSLNAMIAYIASKSGQTEFRVARRLSDYFNIPNPKCLPMTQFDIAIRYLVDVLDV